MGRFVRRNAVKVSAGGKTMQGAQKRSVIVLLLAVAAVFVAAPATALAKPKPVKYVLVSHTKGCLVTLNVKTGKLTFKAEKGRYGKFTVVVKHGKKKTVYHFTVRKPKRGRKPAPGAPGGPPIGIIPVPVPVPVPLPGPAGPTGAPGVPGVPGVPAPPPRPAPVKGVPNNVAPALAVFISPSGDHHPVIQWAIDPGATSYKGAICDAPRSDVDRTCQIIDPVGAQGQNDDAGLPLVEHWDIEPNATTICGTVYFGVASEGSGGELWTDTEVIPSLPKCADQVLPTQMAFDLAGQTPTVYSTNPWEQCTSQVQNISRISGNDTTHGGINNPINPAPLCQAINDLSPNGSPEDPMIAIDGSNKNHLCEDFVAVVEGESDFEIPSSYTVDPATGNCYGVDRDGIYYLMFNASQVQVNHDVIADFVADVASTFPYALPWTTDVP
jgi:hypothetical protein